MADPVVLFIDRSDSWCGACGKSALWHDTSHTTPCGYDSHSGCGATWTHVSSHYMGEEMKAASLRCRPDLPWIDYADAWDLDRSAHK